MQKSKHEGCTFTLKESLEKTNTEFRNYLFFRQTAKHNKQ